MLTVTMKTATMQTTRAVVKRDTTRARGVARVTKRGRDGVRARATQDGKNGPKKLTRENEKEAWLSEMEREGGNPLKDPMALIGIGGIAVPFIILAVASVAGFIGQ